MGGGNLLEISRIIGIGTNSTYKMFTEGKKEDQTKIFKRNTCFLK
jgi:hypothetical protein